VKRLFLLIIALFSFLGYVAADEGNWLYEAFPKDKVKAKYGFEPSQEFLDHLRLSSVRIGASASFVSPDGLIFTNHHVGGGCIHDLSSGGKDYMKDGFYARQRSDEPKCPGLEVSVLVEIRDATPQVQDAAKPGMAPAAALGAQRIAMARLEKDCATGPQFRCEVVPLYSGAMYHLYKYRRYHDVRLVFAPEFQIAFLGGDYDNFTYPRYDLDIAFLRAYENDQPVKSDQYLKWSKEGVKEGDLVFLSGNPGSTGRLLTAAQLEFLRDVQYPFQMQSLDRRIAAMKKFGFKSEEKKRMAERNLFGFQNSLKAISGYEYGLQDRKLGILEDKRAQEKELQDWVQADPGRRKQYGDPWAELAAAEKVHRELYVPTVFLDGPAGLRGNLAAYARTLVRVTAEKQKPDEQRMRGFQDSALPSLEQRLFSTAPVYKEMEIEDLAMGLHDMQFRLAMKPVEREGGEAEEEESHERIAKYKPIMDKILQGRTPEDAAKALLEGTKLDDPAFRRKLYEGGKAAVDASDDPLIVLMRTIDPEARALRREMYEKVDAVYRSAGTTIARIRFARYGASEAPDATGTLRLNFGAVKSYTVGGDKIPWFTTMGGAFQHAAEHEGLPDFQLPPSWLGAKPKLNLETPLDTVNTADSIGGNSGSPAVNTKGELVGILFDGNLQTLTWNFRFGDAVGRSVLTDGRAVIEALRKIYDAGPLADELVGAAK
jgi:hypothetical protein